MSVYGASPIKRARATNDEMEVRAQFLIAYANKHAPVTVRQLFYAATVADMPGIEKDDRGYVKVQRQVLALRREGRLPYAAIADSTRWMRLPRMHDSIADALRETARLYRRNIWRDAYEHVEVWVEKDALAGVILPVTSEFGVPLMVCKGFSSETFAFEAASSYIEDGRPVSIYHLGDFDRSGVDAASDLERKLKAFSAGYVEVSFTRLGVTAAQIWEMELPTRAPKMNSPADRRWPYPFACELDAIPPDALRDIVRAALEQHMPAEDMKVVLAAEQSERAMLWAFARGAS